MDDDQTFGVILIVSGAAFLLTARTGVIVLWKMPQSAGQVRDWLNGQMWFRPFCVLWGIGLIATGLHLIGWF